MGGIGEMVLTNLAFVNNEHFRRFMEFSDDPSCLQYIYSSYHQQDWLYWVCRFV